MQFVWMGFLKSSDPIDQDVQEHITDFLQQPLIPINAAGVLRGSRGERSGYLVIFEAEDRAAAEALARESPIRNAGLYSEYHLFEYQNEIG
ncbi:MAG TPA: YciI family protein [Sphingomicrobium sp.]|nr:YciI family protein [Sphingomicrobium sp.]